MIEGHGDDSYKYRRPITTNFSSNIYTKVDLSGLQAHLCRHIGSISSYPEPEPSTLEQRLAQKHRLPATSVCVTNGATEAIYLIAQTFRGTNSAILQPTFSEYADACCMHGHRVTSLYLPPALLGEETSPSLAHTSPLPPHLSPSLPHLSSSLAHTCSSLSLGDSLPDDIRMLWLCNPNNPTGAVYDKPYLTALITHYPQVCFVIDQSYEYFTLQPLFTAAEAAAFPNVLLLHSQTKRYAIPGLRLGYVTGDADLLNQLRINRMPWSVNQLAIEAGLYLADHDVPTSLDIPGYLHETVRLRAALEKLGTMEVWDTKTHFMLVRLRMGRASALKDYLANEHGILIRDASNFEGLDEHFFRVAAQTPEENDRLVQAIGKWFADF